MGDGSESTIICVDNSDYNINEDIYPDRFISLRDSLNIICENKILSLDHHVGVLLMAGERCKILVALTNSLGKLLNCIHDIQIDGTCDIIKSLSIAQLALKHRMNRNSNQKIVLLLGSPCTANEKQLMTVAKQLKKNNIGIEIVNYGCTSTNRDILKKLYENVNNNENSKYIEVPEDTTNISSVILSAFSNHTYCTFDDVDVSPEIFNTVRETLREDAIANANRTGTTNAADNPVTGPSFRTNDMPTVEEIENMQDIDSDLREALLLSLREYNEGQNALLEETEDVNETTNTNAAAGEQTTSNGAPPTETNVNENSISENKENENKENENKENENNTTTKTETAKIKDEDSNNVASQEDGQKDTNGENKTAEQK